MRLHTTRQNALVGHRKTFPLLCAASIVFVTSAGAQEANINERGTPRQGVYHSMSEIEVPGRPPKKDKYNLSLDDLGAVWMTADLQFIRFHYAYGKFLEVDADYYLSGKWVAVGEAQNELASKRDQAFGTAFVSQLSTEESNSFEKSVGLEIEICAQPLGMGVSETISGSMAWNKTTSTGTSTSKEINTGGMIKYGTGMQAWQFIGVVCIVVDCGNLYRTDAEFQAAMKRATGSVIPYPWTAFKDLGRKTFVHELPTKRISLTEFPVAGLVAEPPPVDNSADLAALRAQLALSEQQRVAAEATAAQQLEANRQMAAAAQAEADRQAALAAAATTQAEAEAAQQAEAAATQLAAASQAQVTRQVQKSASSKLRGPGWMKVKARNAKLRKTAANNGAAQGNLSQGDVVKVTKQNGKWVYVAVKTGRSKGKKGYLLKSWVVANR